MKPKMDLHRCGPKLHKLVREQHRFQRANTAAGQRSTFFLDSSACDKGEKGKSELPKGEATAEEPAEDGKKA